MYLYKIPFIPKSFFYDGITLHKQPHIFYLASIPLALIRSSIREINFSWTTFLSSQIISFKTNFWFIFIRPEYSFPIKFTVFKISNIFLPIRPNRFSFSIKFTILESTLVFKTCFILIRSFIVIELWFRYFSFIVITKWIF